MFIKEYKLDMCKTEQHLCLQSAPLSVAGVNNSIRLYAYSDVENAEEADYTIICITAGDKFEGDEFEPKLIKDCIYLGPVTTGGVGPFGGLFQTVAHVYYRRDTILERVLKKEPLNSLHACAYAEMNYIKPQYNNEKEAVLEC